MDKELEYKIRNIIKQILYENYKHIPMFSPEEAEILQEFIKKYTGIIPQIHQSSVIYLIFRFNNIEDAEKAKKIVNNLGFQTLDGIYTHGYLLKIIKP